MVAESIRERRSKLYRGDQAKEARAGVQARHPLKRDVSVNVSETSGPKPMARRSMPSRLTCPTRRNHRFPSVTPAPRSSARCERATIPLENMTRQANLVTVVLAVLVAAILTAAAFCADIGKIPWTEANVETLRASTRLPSCGSSTPWEGLTLTSWCPHYDSGVFLDRPGRRRQVRARFVRAPGHLL